MTSNTTARSAAVVQEEEQYADTLVEMQHWISMYEAGIPHMGIFYHEGERYLTMITQDARPEGVKYLMIPCSLLQFQALRSGTVTLRAMFDKPELQLITVSDVITSNTVVDVLSIEALPNGCADRPENFLPPIAKTAIDLPPLFELQV